MAVCWSAHLREKVWHYKVIKDRAFWPLGNPVSICPGCPSTVPAREVVPGLQQQCRQCSNSWVHLDFGKLIWKRYWRDNEVAKQPVDATLFWKTHLLKPIRQAGRCGLVKTTSGLALGRDQKGCSTEAIYLKQTKKQKPHYVLGSFTEVQLCNMLFKLVDVSYTVCY